MNPLQNILIEVDERTAATLECAARLEGRDEEELASQILKETLSDPLRSKSLNQKCHPKENPEH